ncbi:MAG: heparinase II/III family protein [Victivallales bacterium]|nr:heparinase II/III family protein [Victivallales bacterium]
MAEAAHTGKYGMRVTDESVQDSFSCASPSLPAKPGHFYVIQFWGRNFGKENVAAIYSRFFDAKGERIPYSKTKKENTLHVSSKDWKQYTLLAKAPEGTVSMDVWIHSFVSKTGQADFDDFTVTEFLPEEKDNLPKANKNQNITPPSQERIAEIAKLLPETPQGCGPRGAERERWLPFVNSKDAQNYIKRAVAQKTEKPVFMDDNVYLNYTRNGNRTQYQNLMGRRDRRLQNFVYAELIEWQGRFLADIEADLERLFQEKSWTNPAHDAQLTSFQQIRCHGDLSATATAAHLAQMDWWLGDKLSPAIRAKLRSECNRRVLDPYREDLRSGTLRSGHWWIDGYNNWNAVCTCNVVRAALILLEDKMERAEVLAGMEFSNPYFLRGFTPDGYCSEGISYWSFGFGHFTMMAETVLEATGGKWNIYENAPNIENICAFARNIQIEEDVCPAFADCGIHASPKPNVIALVQRRFPQVVLQRVPPLTTFSDIDMTSLRLFTDESASAAKAPEKPTFPQRSFFENAGVYIGRTTDETKGHFGVAFKAGNNGEMHNHNDVGSFVVVLNKDPLILDPGNETYTRRTFSAQRYESQMLNSFGHSVPVVAGSLQSDGVESFGEITKKTFTEDQDELVCDMKNAYRKVKELKNLVRTFTFDRKNRRVIVRDEVEFTSPQTFATALISYKFIEKLDKNQFAFWGKNGGVRATIATEGADLNAELGEVFNATGSRPKRIALALVAPVQKGAITITIDILSETKGKVEAYQSPVEPKGIIGQPIQLEAENIAEEANGAVVVLEKPGASGKAFRFWDGRGHAITWKFNIPATGKYVIRVRLANGGEEVVQRSCAIDGKLLHPEKEPLLFPKTGGWANNAEEEWQNVWLARKQKCLSVHLKKGEHTITMKNVDGNGLNLDWIQFIQVK